eukprot:CAMPEP_0183739878 /NCGR_PEP_ID=MMETSP0737-20130205/58267_1 /TAXON_ID=385413 /ORGANISM="Thalassiosira miniscula, Strain CCMP1093" /LENGTH=140 /DNA_ID=CAMNT_0025974791 /DNA_START=32 /DNA_END=450 /DNA_ORIENTATION=+
MKSSMALKQTDERSEEDLPYDRKGRCKQHPQIRLRKRGTLGIGWTTLRLRCPLCVFATLTEEVAALVEKDDNVVPKTTKTGRRRKKETHLSDDNDTVNKPNIPLALLEEPEETEISSASSSASTASISLDASNSSNESNG